MEDSYKKIKSILRKVQRWLLLKAILRNTTLGICVAITLGIFILLLSRIIPIYKVYDICIYLGGVVLALTFVLAIVFLPKLKKVAKCVDTLGLAERITTALELKDRSSIYKEPLVQDAAVNLEKLNYKEKIPLLPSKNFLLAIIVLTVLFSGAMLLPDPLKDKAQQIHDLKVYKNQEEKKVVKAQKEVKEDKALNLEEKKDILAKLEELKKEVKLAESNKEVDKAIEKTAKKLEQAIDQTLPEEVKKLSDTLSEAAETKKLAEAIKSGDLEDIQKQLESLKSSTKTMDPAAKKSLEDTLLKASNSMNPGDLKDSVDELNSALSSGNEDAITKSVNNVKGAVKSGLSTQSKNKALAQAESNLQEGQNPSGQGTGQGQGSGQGTGQGQGTGSEAGQGSGQGSGQGTGQGPGGSGAGSGSGNGDAGVTPYSSGGIANKAPSAGVPKEYEKVFTPSSLGGQGQTSQLTGKNNGNSGSSESSISNDASATLGQLTPYNQVVGNYSEKAMENMNNAGIPSGMEDIVKGYFTSLND